MEGSLSCTSAGLSLLLGTKPSVRVCVCVCVRVCVCVCWGWTEGLQCCPFPRHLGQDMSGERGQQPHRKTPTK